MEIKQGKDFSIVKVTGELTIRSKNGEEPYGLTVLDDESILICYLSGVARYDKAGTLLGRIKKDTEEFQLPSDLCKLRDGNIAVLDMKGIHLLDGSLVFIETLIANNTVEQCGRIYKYSSLAENEDGCILTLLSKLTDEPTRASVYIHDKKGVKVIPLEPLIEEAMELLKSSDPYASHCTHLTYKDGRIYVTGDLNNYLISVLN